MEDEDLVMLLYSLILMNQNTRKKSKPRRFWVKSLYLERKKKGVYQNLLQEMRFVDRETYFR